MRFCCRNYDIRVNKTCGVPATFHCRYDVTSRFYLYKLAIFPNQANIVDSQESFHTWEVYPFQVGQLSFSQVLDAYYRLGIFVILHNATSSIGLSQPFE